MRVLSLQCHDMAHAWSKDGKQHPPEVLAAHLKLIIKEESKRGTKSPPTASVPMRKELPLFGTLTPDVILIDGDQFFAKKTTEEKAEKQ